MRLAANGVGAVQERIEVRVQSSDIYRHEGKGSRETALVLSVTIGSYRQRTIGKQSHLLPIDLNPVVDQQQLAFLVDSFHLTNTNA